jgi:hypothetical protein
MILRVEEEEGEGCVLYSATDVRDDLVPVHRQLRKGARTSARSPPPAPALNAPTTEITWDHGHDANADKFPSSA